MSNSDEAIRQYEQGTLATLRARCFQQRIPSLQTRAEFAGISNGAVLVQRPSGLNGRYTLIAYDKDNRSFHFIDGQALGRGARLQVQLALPRDYANCRILRDAQAREFLEVHAVARNDLSAAEAMQQLYDEVLRAHPPLLAADGTHLAGFAPPLCANAPAPVAGSNQLSVRANGAAVRLASCSDAMVYVAERMDALMRKVFGR